MSHEEPTTDEAGQSARDGASGGAPDGTGRPLDREELASAHLAFARIIAARLYAGRQTDEVAFDEYMQLASVGLMEAIDRYDPAQGAGFRTYAAHRIRGAVLNGLSQLTERQRQIDVRQRIRRERLESIRATDDADESMPVDGLSLEQIRANALFRELAQVGVGVALSILLEDSGLIAGPEGIGPERYFRNAELGQLRRRLKDATSRLPERERRILTLHYDQDIAFSDIAEQMGVTKGRIAQLHRRALDQLRQTLQAAGLRDSWL